MMARSFSAAWTLRSRISCKRRHDRRERIAQLVAEHREELVLGPVGRLRLPAGLGQLRDLEDDDGDAVHAPAFVEDRLIDEIEKNLLRLRLAAGQQQAHRTADEGLAGCMDAIEQLIDPLIRQLGQRLANRFSEHGTIRHELEVGRVGQLVDVLRAAQDGDSHRSVLEDAREAAGMQLLDGADFSLQELRLDTRHEIARGERFDQVVVGAGAPAVDL